MNRLKVFLFNSIIITITSFLIRSIDIFFGVYIANKIGSEGSGIFELIMSIYLFATTIANGGIYLAATRIVTEELELNGIPGIKIAMKKCLSYSFVLGALAFILLFATTPFFTETILDNKISTLPLYILAFSLPFNSLATSLARFLFWRTKSFLHFCNKNYLSNS